MKPNNTLKTLIPTAFGLVVLILDCGTAIEGARAGLEVCFHTVLPSLFPFIFLSSILTASLLSGNFSGNRFLCKLYRIPRGAEGILLIGLLGGYPVGAKCIGEAVADGRLSQTEGERMLIFCNAVGPAFLFGITGRIFIQRWVPWCLWGIHLLSSLCMARLLPPSDSNRNIKNTAVPRQTVAQRLRQSVQVMGEICGWIILMRTLIAFIEKWSLKYFPEPLSVLITGILELTNGCLNLQKLDNTGLSFLLCSVLLGFGGLCVAMQTASVAPAVNQQKYLPGKCIQAGIGFIFAYIAQYLFLKNGHNIRVPWLFYSALAATSCIIVYLHLKSKKVVEI